MFTSILEAFEKLNIVHLFHFKMHYMGNFTGQYYFKDKLYLKQDKRTVQFLQIFKSGSAEKLRHFEVFLNRFISQPFLKKSLHYRS